MFKKYVQKICSKSMFKKYVQKVCSKSMFKKYVQKVRVESFHPKPDAERAISARASSAVGATSTSNHAAG